MLNLECYHKEKLDYHRRVTVVGLRNGGLTSYLCACESNRPDSGSLADLWIITRGLTDNVISKLTF